MGLLGPIIALLVFVAPFAFAIWLGTRVRWPVVALFLAWVSTPLTSVAVMVVLWPLLQRTAPPNNDGTWAIMIPIYGIAAGFFAGIAAAVIVDRRRKKAETNSGEVVQHEPLSN